MIDKVRRVLFEEGPLTMKEIKYHIGRCNRSHLWNVLNRHEDVFHVVGYLKQPSAPPQNIYGLVGVFQPLVKEEKKAHPFDLPKHTIFYRDLVSQQRVVAERY